MTVTNDSVPTFIREAFAEEDTAESAALPEDAAVSESLLGLLGAESATGKDGDDGTRGQGGGNRDGVVANVASVDEAVLARLLAAVESLPLRYAQFYDRLSELFDLPEAELVTLLEREDWKRTPLPGIREREVTGGPRRKGSELRLVRFAPGAYFPSHTHGGRELVLILEGGYRDESGVDYLPGDLHEMSEGTKHSFRVHDDGPCVAASVLGGHSDYEAWPLKVLDWLIRRK
jgi:putative transcriptional regulator